MKQATLSVWTLEDWTTNLCTKEEVGKPKVFEQSPEDVIASAPPATMAELKQAALRVARGKMGYDEFLAKNPSFHLKFLLSMAKEQLPQERPDVTVNISWLSQDRLAYKQGALLDVVSEGKAIENQVTDVAWKEDPRTPYQKARDKD